MANIEQIRNWMRANRISHAKIAEEIGAHRNTVTRALNGQFGSSRVLEAITALMERSAELHLALDPGTRRMLRDLAAARHMSEAELASLVLQNAMAPFKARDDSDETTLEAAEDPRD